MTGAAEVRDRLATFKQAMKQLSAIGNIRVLVTGEMVSTAMAPRAEDESGLISLGFSPEVSNSDAKTRIEQQRLFRKVSNHGASGMRVRKTA